MDDDLDDEGREAPEEEFIEQDGPGLFDGAPADASTPALAESAPGKKAAVEPLTASASPAAGAVDEQGAPLALYRRYRPDTFEQVIGQEHVTLPLQRAIANNRVNHAYLFSGPRGCGKTTSARILARCLNCEQGPTPTPCGHCTSCRELATGGPGSIDVIEIDAASHGRVDDARELREGIYFAPVQSRFKIYIIDEAHMVTKEGFNALLKVVEEPPPHVKFIFATTEPDKVIGTIRSRTHHYPFRLVPPKVLSGYLEEICADEKVAVEPGVLPLVVRAGAGSVRDSMSVLDQLLGSAENDAVSYQQATSLLGYTPDALLDEMIDALAVGDGKGVFATIDKVIEIGQDPRRFADDLLQRLRDLVIVADVPDALSSGLIDVSEDQGQRFTQQAAALGAGELTRAAEVIANGLTQMRGTTAPRLHLELMCARMLLPGADVDERGTHARLDRLERRIGMPGVAAPEAAGGGQTPEPAAQWDDQAQVQTRDVPVENRQVQNQQAESHNQNAQREPEPVRHEMQPEPQGNVPDQPDRSVQPDYSEHTDHSEHTAAQHGAEVPDVGPASGDADLASAPEASESVAATGGFAAETPVQTPAASGALNTAEVRRLWPEVLAAVKGRRRFTWILLSQNAQVLQADVDGLSLVFNSAGARDSFQSGGSDAVLRQALVDVMGADLPIHCVVEGTAALNEARGGEPAGQRPAPEQSIASGQRSSLSQRPAPGEGPAEGAATNPPADGGGQAGGSSPKGKRRRHHVVSQEDAVPDPSADALVGQRPAGQPPVDEQSQSTAQPDTAPAESDGDGAEPPHHEIVRAEAAPSDGPAYDPDADVSMSDPDIDESGQSAAELLISELGAEVIEEIEHGV